jgi:hypothetical protein
MLVQGKVHGNASAAVKAQALNFVNWLAARNGSINQMVLNPNILALITVQHGEGDQQTTVEWKNAKTRIYVTIYIKPAEGPQSMRASLLHELILHANPAIARHVAAAAQGIAPVYAIGDLQIEAEEQAEHTNADLWYLAASIALADSTALMEQLIADAATHDEDVATQVVNRLRDQGLITPNAAEELINGVINYGSEADNPEENIDIDSE